MKIIEVFSFFPPLFIYVSLDKQSISIFLNIPKRKECGNKIHLLWHFNIKQVLRTIFPCRLTIINIFINWLLSPQVKEPNKNMSQQKCMNPQIHLSFEQEIVFLVFVFHKWNVHPEYFRFTLIKHYCGWGVFSLKKNLYFSLNFAMDFEISDIEQQGWICTSN